MSFVSSLKLDPRINTPDKLDRLGTRDGFGQGLLTLGKRNARVVALCADLAESTRMHWFAEAFPDRFVQVGVAEQNLVTVASGMAAMGLIPFASSFAAFSPGRNWEQIRTTICYNDQPVKIVSTHAGLSVGPDGATHQMLEDVALMRALPNMAVIVPADSEQARAATLAIARDPRPTYMRLAREKFPVFTTAHTPFEIGKAQVLQRGSDVTVIACGNMVHQAILASQALTGRVSIELINVHTIKPLDRATILRSARKTGQVITIEEHQITGGLGGAVAELLSEALPTPLLRLGVQDAFGESGEALELWQRHGLDVRSITRAIVRQAG